MKVNCNLVLFFTAPEGCCIATEWALVYGMRVSGGGVQPATPHIHCSGPAPSSVTAASVMNDSAVGPSKRTGGHETNHSCQALIFPWESHLHPPHPSLGTGLPPYSSTYTPKTTAQALWMRARVHRKAGGTYTRELLHTGRKKAITAPFKDPPLDLHIPRKNKVCLSHTFV